MATNENFGGKWGKLKMKVKRRREYNSGEVELEDYHTEASASVPFMWESEPGTPKDKFRQHGHENNGAFVSPLTPPPYYFSNTTLSSSDHSLANIKTTKSSTTTNFLNTVFKKLSVNAPPSPASSSSSSSSLSSSSSSSTPTSSRRERPGRVGSPSRLSFEWRVGELEEEEELTNNVESPVSTLFFGRGGPNRRGCCPKLLKVFTKDFK